MSRRRVYLSAVAVWLVFLAVAFGLGAVRELLVAPAIGEQGAHVLGTLTFVGVMLGVTATFVGRIRPRYSFADLWLVGLLWLALTVAFEFLFFHYVAGKPWEALLAAYNVVRGRLWALVPLTELLGPPALGWLLRRPAAQGLPRINTFPTTDTHRKRLPTKPPKMPRPFSPTVRRVAEIVPQKAVAKIKPHSPQAPLSAARPGV